MADKQTDILLIRKYLKGELDAKAMHQLERRAQADPFLMDALEGYELARGDQQAPLDDLAGRIKRRVQPKQRCIIPLRIISIAASALIICTAGIWWFSGKHSNLSPRVAAINKPPVQKRPVLVEKAIANDQTALATLKAAPPERIHKLQSAKRQADAAVSSAGVADAKGYANIKDSVRHDSTPLNEMIVLNYKNKSQNDAAGAAPVADRLKKAQDTNPKQLLQGQAKGVAANNVTAKPLPPGMVFPGKVQTLSINTTPPMDRKMNQAKNVIRGQVIGTDDKLPLPGATVRIKGTNIGTVTDANGQFTLPADSGKANLTIGYVGYQTQEVSTQGREPVKTMLKPSGSALNEVVVISRNNHENAGGAGVVSAHPTNGWHSFKKYLKAKAVSPDGQKGVVRLSFNVDRNGAVSDIKVLKGLTTATNQAAIALINNGPPWTASSGGGAEAVKVRIKFVK